MFYRPTWAEISLGNIAHNLRLLRRSIDKDTKVLVTVKADAYGHGIVAVSRKLVSCGVAYLGVASIDEALVIRNSGIKCNILILGGMFPRDARIVVGNGFIQTLFDWEAARALNLAAKRCHKRAQAHIKIDTGMRRLGVWHEQAVEFIRSVSRLKFLDIRGVFTHLACADSDPVFTRRQISLFRGVVDRLECNGLNIGLRHIANSVGTLGFRDSHFNLVRPGIVVYGLRPCPGISSKFKPALSLKSRIVSIKDVPAGQGVSYGHRYITREKTSIAVIPIGYGDGYPRALSNKAKVLIKGRKIVVAGAVCMDYIMADLGRMRGVECGDTVTLIGKDRGKTITAEELARAAGTICYEIVCGIGSRVPRIYV